MQDTPYRALAIALLAAIAIGRSSWADQAGEATRFPVPAPAALAHAKQLIGEIYKEEYRTARDDAQKSLLAKKLVTAARDTRADISARYALLEIATDLAGKAGDIETGWDAIDLLEKGYAIDAVIVRGRLLRDAARKSRTPGAQKAAVAKISAVVERAVTEDRFHLARPLADLALALARNSRDAELAKQIVAARDDIDRFEAEFARVKESLATLETDPTNPTANLQVGRYRCYVKNDWDRGIPMLALGGDLVLKRIALIEMQEKQSIDDWVTLGDGWWMQLSTLQGTQAWNVGLAASERYQRALPALAGLQKARIEKRLEEIGKLSPGRAPQWISRDATYTVSSQHPSLPPLGALLNGGSEMHGQGDGSGEFAFHSASQRGPHIVIDLKQRRTITRLVIENRVPDKEKTNKSGRREVSERAKRLSVWVSSLPAGRGPLVWRADDAKFTWIADLRYPMTGRYITIGLPEDESGSLHLRRVQVYGY